jgi:putative transposase
MRRSKSSDEQILAIVKEGEAGRKVADLCRTHGITEQTYYRWEGEVRRPRAERDAAVEAAQRRESAHEADRRGADAGHSGDEDGHRKNVVGPSAKREAVGWLINAQATSLRRGCRVVGLSTATWRYQCRGRADHRALLARLQAHAAVRARHGYRRLHTLITRADRVPLPRPSSRGERWSMDFMLDNTGGWPGLSDPEHRRRLHARMRVDRS